MKLLVYNAYICNPILLAGIFITGEYKRLLEYFSNNAEGINEKYYGYYGTFFFLFLSAFFCFILTSSFFISNEKISSLMTNLLNNSRTIFISASLYFFDSSKKGKKDKKDESKGTELIDVPDKEEKGQQKEEK